MPYNPEGLTTDDSPFPEHYDIASIDTPPDTHPLANAAFKGLGLPSPDGTTHFEPGEVEGDGTLTLDTVSARAREESGDSGTGVPEPQADRVLPTRDTEADTAAQEPQLAAGDAGEPPIEPPERPTTREDGNDGRARLHAIAVRETASLVTRLPEHIAGSSFDQEAQAEPTARSLAAVAHRAAQALRAAARPEERAVATQTFSDAIEAVKALAPDSVPPEVIADMGLTEIAIIGEDQATLLRNAVDRERTAEDDPENAATGMPTLEAAVRECARRDQMPVDLLHHGWVRNEDEWWLRWTQYNAERVKVLQERLDMGDGSVAHDLEDERLRLNWQTRTGIHPLSDEFWVTHTPELLADPTINPAHKLGMVIFFTEAALSPDTTLTPEVMDSLEAASAYLLISTNYGDVDSDKFFTDAQLLKNSYNATGGDPSRVRQTATILDFDQRVSQLITEAEVNAISVFQEDRPDYITGRAAILLRSIQAEVDDMRASGALSSEGATNLAEDLRGRYAEAFAHAGQFEYSGFCLEAMQDTSRRAAALRVCWDEVQDNERLRLHTHPAEPLPPFRIESGALLMASPLAQPSEEDRTQWRTVAPDDEASVETRYHNLAAETVTHTTTSTPWESLVRLTDAIRDPRNAYAQLRAFTQSFTVATRPYKEAAPFVQRLLMNPLADNTDFQRIWDWIDGIQDPAERLQAMTDFEGLTAL